VSTFSRGLLGRRDALASRRPSVARVAWSYGGDWKDGDHAALASAAFMVRASRPQDVFLFR